MTVLESFNKFDRHFSQWIHRKDHFISTVILYPFAAFFHPGLIWLSYLTIFSLSHGNIRFTAVYALGTLFCLLATTFIKKIAKRPRPELIEHVKKPHHFRKKQKNHAMPSGDAIQSALFIVYLYNLEVDFRILLLFHIAVCLGRVYYMCHWIADTMVASILGSIIGRILLSFHEANYFQFVPENLL